MSAANSNCSNNLQAVKMRAESPARAIAFHGVDCVDCYKIRERAIYFLLNLG